MPTGISLDHMFHLSVSEVLLLVLSAELINPAFSGSMETAEAFATTCQSQHVGEDDRVITLQHCYEEWCTLRCS